MWWMWGVLTNNVDNCVILQDLSLSLSLYQMSMSVRSVVFVWTAAVRTWQDPIDVCVMRASCLRLTAKSAEVSGTQPIKLNNMLVNGNFILPFRMVLNSTLLLPAQVHSKENKYTVIWLQNCLFVSPQTSMSVRITVCVLTVTALTLRDHSAASVTLVTSLHKREATAKVS